jgi:Na+/melibiose symporter-like transporter
MVLALLFGPIGILQGIYAKHYGLTLTTIASVLLVARLFDAFTDPLIGYFSDRCHDKSGTRKPFVIVGGLLLIISSYFLYVPFQPSTTETNTVVSTTYFLGWFLAFYLAWTLFEIPHLAWASEITGTSREKNKIYSFREFAVGMGIFLFYLVPLLPLFDTNEFTPETLRWAALIAGTLMLPTLYYCIKLVPNGPCINYKDQKKSSVWELRSEIIANKPFLMFLAAYVLYGIGCYMWFSLMFIFIDAYLDLNDSFALLSICALAISMALVGFWYWMANRYGKKSTWIAGVFLYFIGLFIAGFLGPGQASIFALAAVMGLAYVGSTPIGVVSPSLLSDIIDYNTWKFGSDRSATYFSVYTLTLKTSIATGGSIGLGLAGWYGFNPANIEHSDNAILGLRFAACWLPMLFMSLSMVVMSWIPIDDRRHSIVLRRLDTRLQRQSRQYQRVAVGSATKAFEPISS